MDQLLNLEELGRLVTTYLPKVAGAILTLVIGFWIIGRITNMLQGSMEKRKIDETIRPFLLSLVSVGLKVLLLFSVASMFGIETTSFVALFGALAFAVGMALQGSLAHFASGVLILIFKPYKVGDLVEIGGGQTGHVVAIQVFNTILKTLDNRRIIVPNSVVTGNVITNISGQGTMGVDMTFGIGYGDDIDKARSVIEQVAKACPYVLEEPETLVKVSELGNSSVNFLVRPWIKSEDYWATYFYMHEHVKKEFDKAGVSIPFPQMDVHFDQQAIDPAIINGGAKPAPLS
ncbi:MAG TPA: mechanosensitive ion channel domain-containing protein [Phaeodactylibacter sp.]|nr:mechanosensitive ion channel domain-containing protein [Phaeodactylibacter sp.]